MDRGLKTLVFVAILVKLASSIPVYEDVEKNLSAAVQKAGQKQRLNNKLITIDSIISKIVLPTDTDTQKEAKKVIAQYLIQLASQVNSTSPHKSSKSSSGNTRYTSAEDEKMKDAIIAALIEAERLSSSGDSRVSRQLNLTTQVPPLAITEPPLNANNTNTTTASSGVEASNTVEQHQTMVLTHVKDLVENVQMGNLTGVLNTGLKVASVETIGVVVNGLLNLVLCNPFDRWTGNCNLSIVKANTKRRPRPSF